MRGSGRCVSFAKRFAYRVESKPRRVSPDAESCKGPPVEKCVSFGNTCAGRTSMTSLTAPTAKSKRDSVTVLRIPPVKEEPVAQDLGCVVYSPSMPGRRCAVRGKSGSLPGWNTHAWRCCAPPPFTAAPSHAPAFVHHSHAMYHGSACWSCRSGPPRCHIMTAQLVIELGILLGKDRDPSDGQIRT